jgi:hypothetical protein
LGLQSDPFKATFGAALPAFLEQIAMTCLSGPRVRDADFLMTLYATAIETPSSPHWVRISNAIGSYWSQICEALSNTERFGGVENSLSKLFLAIARQKGSVDSRVLKHSIDLMFRFPANSFLANFVAAAIRLYVELGGRSGGFLRTPTLSGRSFKVTGCPRSSRSRGSSG